MIVSMPVLAARLRARVSEPGYSSFKIAFSSFASTLKGVLLTVIAFFDYRLDGETFEHFATWRELIFHRKELLDMLYTKFLLIHEPRPPWAPTPGHRMTISAPPSSANPQLWSTSFVPPQVLSYQIGTTTAWQSPQKAKLKTP